MIHGTAKSGFAGKTSAGTVGTIILTAGLMTTNKQAIPLSMYNKGGELGVLAHE